MSDEDEEEGTSSPLRAQFALAFAVAHVQSGESERASHTAIFAVRYADALLKELSK